jgi:hypothetical protein
VSSVASPFGLRPSYHPSGTIRPTATTIASGYNANIFQYAPVGYVAAGSIALSPAGGTGITGAVGSFQGVEYTPSVAGSRRVYSNTWPANQAATDIVAYITEDPYITYTIQANGSVAMSAVGAQFNWTTNDTSAGNTTTGLSNVALDTGSGAANAGLRILGLTPAPDNAWGDAFTQVDVQLSQHQFVAAIAQI